MNETLQIPAKEKPNLVQTIKEKCRVCYTCVRECPAKAIRIAGGQAEIISDRCIACGNCTKVCSQSAKVYRQDIGLLYEVLGSGKPGIAIVAPSFPSEFAELEDFRILTGMIRSLGFQKVVEVSFGADLVARKYKEHLQPDTSSISSDCPAIVSYIEKYFPGLVPNLSKVVSPMVATARVVRKKYGQDTKVVFFGPCIAKKDESDEIDCVISFQELRKVFTEKRIMPKNTKPENFDPPLSGRGAIFPLTHGLLNTMEVNDDLLTERVISAGGRTNFQDALREFELGLLKGHHMHLLCCEGCILGPGMSQDLNITANSLRYTKKARIISYANQKMASLDKEQWQSDLDEFSQVDLSRSFTAKDMRIVRPREEAVKEVLYRLGKFSSNDHLNCGACGYDTCEDHAIAILNGFAESEMCLPYSLEKLHKYIKDLSISNNKLASVQDALRQSEKLAGMGQLSAGIAHELNNPLGVITMYSNILKEELPEGDQMRADLDLIVEQADRCRKIVGGLLNFARKNQVSLSEADVVEFCERSISSVVIPSNIKVKLKNSMSNRYANIDKDQMMQVVTNLLKNAIEAMPKGGDILLELGQGTDTVKIDITDSGTGIEKENMGKLFTPFFTTKGIGQGTGLGLPIIYGIVKMHKGNITVKSNADPSKGKTGTTFSLSIPR